MFFFFFAPEPIRIVNCELSLCRLRRNSWRHRVVPGKKRMGPEAWRRSRFSCAALWSVDISTVGLICILLLPLRFLVVIVRWLCTLTHFQSALSQEIDGCRVHSLLGNRLHHHGDSIMIFHYRKTMPCVQDRPFHGTFLCVLNDPYYSIFQRKTDKGVWRYF